MSEHERSAVFVVAAAIAYLLPSLVALGRRQCSRDAVFVINLVLGWTVIGYLFVLAWALTGEAAPRRRDLLATAASLKTCPRCAEDVKAAAHMCRYCGHEF
ncbi:superinfection immunity protein [Roseospirillum parvum]|uniref:Uncharacterized protein family UPF0547 n=1 Tax=Roseospirillum parvum TaxID=83401 RepID=A0A1G7ZX81_9PROT|nr:superinfection immunity protein [Roseospirillum parvum]SDH13285.1 Uncharacterised protein family UPF0547 [Roseospirillum parvum]